jgi:hypothetical protein
MVGTSMLYMSESLSKTSSMVGRSAGSVIHNSFELALRSAAGLGLGLDGTVPVRQHSSIRVTNASGKLALHKIGIIESPATGDHASTHLFDRRYGKPRVLRDNLRRNLRRQHVSCKILSLRVCVSV